MQIWAYYAIFYAVHILACTLIPLTFGDCYLTIRVIAGGGYEANPAEGLVMRLVGSKWVIFRFLITLAVIWAVFWMGEYSWQALCVVTLVNVVFAWVVWNNWALWRTLSPRNK